MANVVKEEARKSRIKNYFTGGSRYELKRKAVGALFAAPWLIGVFVFFLGPLFQTLVYSFTSTTMELEVSKLAESVFYNYDYIFTKSTTFLTYYRDAVTSLLYALPLTVIFSMFIAKLLVNKFHGRTFMRAIFFLPVIVASGIIMNLVQSGLSSVLMGDGTGGGNIFDSSMLTDLLLNNGFPSDLVNWVSGMVQRILDLVWKSGVQILIFMAGMLAIPSTYYEVAAVEGATGWESFWKITFPLSIPYVLINSIYTVIDVLGNYNNYMIRHIVSSIYEKHEVSFAAAMSWVYIITILVIVGLLALVLANISRRLNAGISKSGS